MKLTNPAIPKLMKRHSTLHGVAPCANAPTVLTTPTGYRTHNPRAARTSARTREAVRVDRITRAVRP